jgi:hypothetical protein
MPFPVSTNFYVNKTHSKLFSADNERRFLKADFPMYRALFLFLCLLWTAMPVKAQSVTDNLPPFIIQGESAAEKPSAAKESALATKESAVVGDPYTVTDVNADVTADTAAHARDQALMKAERTAYTQLCGRLGATDNSDKLDDDALAALVQSFDLQSEHLSAVRYIGVFTIHFNPAAVQKKVVISSTPSPPAPVAEAKALNFGPVSHATVAVQADSLATWLQIKRRLNLVPFVAKIDTTDIGRGIVHIDLSYNGTLDNLKQATTDQGLVLCTNGAGVLELYDGSMAPR